MDLICVYAKRESLNCAWWPCNGMEELHSTEIGSVNWGKFKALGYDGLSFDWKVLVAGHGYITGEKGNGWIEVIF